MACTVRNNSTYWKDNPSIGHFRICILGKNLDICYIVDVALCMGAQERSGLVVECLTRDRGGRGFEPHRRHCVVVLELDTFILA